MTLNGAMAVTLRYFSEFGKPVFQHVTASICGGIHARVYCILLCVYDVVVTKVHIRYLISWWVSCLTKHSFVFTVFYRPIKRLSMNFKTLPSVESLPIWHCDVLWKRSSYWKKLCQEWNQASNSSWNPWNLKLALKCPEIIKFVPKILEILKS